MRHYYPCFYIHFDKSPVKRVENIYLVTVSSDSVICTEFNTFTFEFYS